MTTIAVVGAGPGLGAAVARRFGTEGFAVAVSRRQDRVDALATELSMAGLTARGHAADVRDPGSLTVALQQAADDLGPVEVVQYSPVPQADSMRSVLDTTVADLTGAIEFSLYGPVPQSSRCCCSAASSVPGAGHARPRRVVSNVGRSEQVLGCVPGKAEEKSDSGVLSATTTTKPGACPGAAQ